MPEQDPSQDSFRDMLEDIRRSSRETLTRITELELCLEKHDDLLYRGNNDVPGLAYRVRVVELDVAVIKAKETRFWGELWKLILAAIIGAGSVIASQFTWNPPDKP